MTYASCKGRARKSFSPYRRKTRLPGMCVLKDRPIFPAVFKSANTRRTDWHGNCIHADAGYYAMLRYAALCCARALAQPAQGGDIFRLHIIQISVEESSGGSYVCNQAVCYARSTLVKLGRKFT